MELFIDLAKIAEGQPEPILPGINLNLSGLVNFNKPEESPNVAQGQLKTETELTIPNFNPLEYFAQIQAEFAKIKSAQESVSIKDDVKTFQAVQQNSNAALDPLASYFEQRFNKIETITSDKEEIRQLIQGQSDNRFSDIQSIITNQLTQTAELEKESSISSISNTIGALVTELTEKPKLTQPENIAAVASTNLINSQETRFDQTSQNVSNLSETISNFATNILNGGVGGATSAPGEVSKNMTFSEPNKSTLQITKDIVKPDFGAASLSALKQMAENTQTLTNSSNFVTSENSQYNTNTVNQGQAQPNMEMPTAGGGNTVVMPGGQSDNSAVYLMQMLNLMKSGQLRVKL
jgi:hypothetical protein